MKKILILIFTLLVSVTLTACEEKVVTLEDLGLAGLTAKEILTGVAEGTIETSEFGLSVYDDELVVIIDEQRLSLDMPEDEFYLSVAPYKMQTHECLYHSATGCRGELKSESFHIKYVTTDGSVILDESIDTLSNGFIDLWLPRDTEGTLTIVQGELTATESISTFAGDKTCLTTMQLS